jgi:hypothetical protein
MTGQTQKTDQQSQSTSAPWAPAQPMLQNILGQISQGNLGPTSGQTGAVQNLVNTASGLPNFGPQAGGAVNNLFNVSTTPQQNTLTAALNAASPTFAGMLSPDFVNPYNNPALKGAMDTMANDIQNTVAGQYAAAGRPVGTNADEGQAVARGIAQGEAPTLASEYNTLQGLQANAATALPAMTGQVEGQLTNLQQVPLQSGLQAMQAAGMIPGLTMQPGQTMLSTQNMMAGLPTMNVPAIEGMTIPIAGLGGQNQGTTTGTTTMSQSPLATAIGAGTAGLGMLGAFYNPYGLSGMAAV